MRKRVMILCGLVCAAILASLSAIAQEKPKTAEPPQIDELLWMVGDWQAVEKADDGGELLVHLRARKSENQQALLYYVWIESKGHVTPKYNGMYYWARDEKLFRLLQVDSDGNITQGTYEQTGNRAVQKVKAAAKNGDIELKSEYEIRPREFHFVAQFRPAGKTEWMPALDITYSRVGEGALPAVPKKLNDD